MDIKIDVNGLQDLDDLEDRLVKAGKGLVFEFGFMCRRCLDNRNNCSEKSSVLNFFQEAGRDEIGYHPVDEQKRISMSDQIFLTFTIMAAVDATRWLFKNHPEVDAYSICVGEKCGVDIVSTDPKNKIVAEVFFSANHDQTLHTKMVAADIRRLNEIASNNPKYLFITSESSKNGEYEHEGVQDGVPIMIRGVNRMSSHGEQEAI